MTDKATLLRKQAELAQSSTWDLPNVQAELSKEEEAQTKGLGNMNLQKSQSQSLFL